MADKPIIFSSAMTRALLDGRKSQTRRVLKPPYGTLELTRNGWKPIYTKAFKGDRLWVREAHSTHNAHGTDRQDGKRWGPWGGLPTAVSPDGDRIAYYREGFDRCGFSSWRPSIHMPRWASRLTLIVTDVRVQRLQEISRGDAMGEGCPFPNMADGDDPREWFRDIWNDIYGPEAWAANPWVAAISFETRKCNIDQMPGGNHE